MAEPFEFVSRGMELTAQGNYSAAVESIQNGIREYERRRDADGITFALGRLGDCYEHAGETDQARAAYEKALQIGTDIPATYAGLIGILVLQNDVDHAFQVAELWQVKGARHLSHPAQEVFIGLAGKLTRLARHQDAINLLQRTIVVLPKYQCPDLHWLARGHLGQAYEQAGDVQAAMKLYSDAIEDGSSDQKTYTRYLINLEKQKQYDEALRILQIALRIQNDAAWEADLRKREQRLLQKTGTIPKGAPKALIPDFAVRSGKESISLSQQIQFSPQLSLCTCAGSHIYGVSGGKTPKLVAYDLGQETHAWEVELPTPADNIVAVGKTVVVLSREGIVGNGHAPIYFYDAAGRLMAQQKLPDVATEIVVGGGQIYVGCRDGKLYAFSLMGQPLWAYSVPGSGPEPETPYFRPCPYYVVAADNLVAFSSFEKAFVLSPQGQLLYRWSVPEEKSSVSNGLFVITASTGPSSIRAIAVAQTGRRILVASDRDVFELINGRVVQKVKPNVDFISSIGIAPSGAMWAVSGADQVILFRDDDKQGGSVPVKGFGHIHFNEAADRLIAWAGKNMSVATCAGTLLARVEFAKDVKFVMCRDDGRLIIGTRYIFLFDTSSRSSSIN